MYTALPAVKLRRESIETICSVLSQHTSCSIQLLERINFSEQAFSHVPSLCHLGTK
ncbi:hypothetical protein ARMSODRAFT_291886 [Armillaria solidipes]|uniref:Uncharacterized protein n=1 Tax=Armillaria solidipes TaxID=1076256 RepID=A0A2H3BLX2_9AGAR|nr:hypothetical protein ARMSODRAFT_291886 [Armillaria solidipes]